MRTLHALALLALLAPVAAAEKPPAVAVTFRVESADFKTTLTETHLRQIEEIIAMHARTRFPFVEWLTATQGAAEASLVVTIVDDPKPPDGNDNYLQYEVMLGSEKESLDFTSSEPLYRWYEFAKPKKNPEQLLNAICTRITCDFTTKELGPTIQQDLLQHIPLPTEKPWSTPSKRLVVPLTWRRVAADRGSMLEVEFKSQRPNLPKKEGHAEVTYLNERSEAPGAGVIEGMLQKYVRDSVVTKNLGEWPPEVDDVFAPEALQQWTVYMRIYKKRRFVDTSKGRVMQPGVGNADDRSAAASAKRTNCLCSPSR
jgi:hypothetical protein